MKIYIIRIAIPFERDFINVSEVFLVIMNSVVSLELCIVCWFAENIASLQSPIGYMAIYARFKS